ncbi:MAG TPA: DNA cytosine methyltransferase [Burkholderiaceae bacterium]
MTAYYNEIDPYAAEWLRNLIAAGHIAPGEVDQRSIEDVHPDDLRGFTQCHFFAGIGVWSYALRRAGWADDRPVWTGSCPCQPFSAAGQGAGFDDERHLWPAFFHLIRERRPAKIIGEQVASKDAEPWLDLVQDDLEGVGYAFGAVPFPSAGVGAPHIRDRLYWVADAQRTDRRRQAAAADYAGSQTERSANRAGGRSRTSVLLGDTSSVRRDEPEHAGAVCREKAQAPGDCRGDGAGPAGSIIELAIAERVGPVNGFWRAADWIACRDDRWRPVEPGTFPLAHGAPARVGRLRAYGNAINAEAARVFIEAFMTEPNPLPGDHHGT